MFKGIRDMASLMKSAQQMGGRMQAMTEELKSRRVSGSAGGGMVEAEVNGAGEVLNVNIDATLIERGEKEMIEDLVRAAVNQANAHAKQLHAEAMQSMTDGLNVPGLSDAIAELTGDSDDKPEDPTN